ncbi:hypothetical protein [Labrenzia sp. 011]|nr:hypothetical protein [Labrenzia sp. 011]
MGKNLDAICRATGCARCTAEIIRTFTSDEVTEDNLIQAISGIIPDKVA